MHRVALRALPNSAGSAARLTRVAWCSSVGAAPKKPRGAVRPNISGVGATSSVNPNFGREFTPKAEASFTTDEIAKRLQEIDQIDEADVKRMHHEFEAKSYAESRVLNEDSLYQLDVSTATRQQGALRVFWKRVDIEPATGHGMDGWYKITLDGRKVKAFENTNQLVLPSKEYALAVAEEYAAQAGHVNKLLMPLTDLASGAMLVAAQGIPARVDYLMSFFMTDNCYFRAEAIQEQQDKIIAPVAEWFDRTFDLHSPRIVGIGHPNIPGHVVDSVRQQLLKMNLNQHQIVALCVVAQFTASLMLPLAMFNNIITIEEGLKINRAEEAHNVEQHGEIHGYHDIREADSIVKVAAAVTAWQLTAGIPAEQYGAINSQVQ